ncbi:sulfotransferase family protein [Frateuria hangzhouensis]|uniref:sulfotransferase family protein n=1 Tax=Frateuria hangzhouensis TaxID=2995589 RepID=UPI002260AFB8|nr:sulfotransferase [Frateuria sp. STR12]MCX7513509.1 sulfotransferase [Frateuria sp. STR12]
MRFHFISGLPRSGSTLLAALLRQNPRFHAGMSSPVAGMVAALLGDMSGRNEYSVFIDDAKRQRVLRGVVENFYADLSNPVVFDTNRAWCARMGALRAMLPQSRVIACVRDMPWVIDSVERLVQRNAFQPSSIFHYATGGTVYSRADGVANGEGLVGYPYNALKEAFFGEHAGNLMLLQYETLVGNPRAALAAVYDFIGEPVFEHDFERVEYDASAFDRKAGTPGLHDVRPRVGAVQRDTVLPPDVFRRFENDAFWRNPELNRRDVRIV